MERAVYAALEDGKSSCRCSHAGYAAHIFLGRVVGRTVAVEFLAHPFTHVGFVSYQVRTCGWRNEGFAQCLRGYVVRDMAGAHFAVTRDQDTTARFIGSYGPL